MRSITLYLPGLFHFISEFTNDDLSDLTSLRRFLNYGVINSIDPLSYLDQITDLFGIENQKDADIPYAALSRLVDEASRPQGVWMRVDPIHLKPTANGLILMDSRQFSLNQHDALALAALLRDKFIELNCTLEVPVADRWYLQLPNIPNIKTSSIYEVAGQDVSDYMLQGEHKAQWLSLLNEIQMMLHDCSINEQRNAKGEPVINSLWFWGVGELPNSYERYWSKVYCDDSIVKGLCMLSSTENAMLEESRVGSFEDELGGENLFILPGALQAVQYDEPFGWLESVHLLESQWLNPMLLFLINGTIDNLEIITEGYRLSIKRSVLLRFWKGRKSIKSFFN